MVGYDVKKPELTALEFGIGGAAAGIFTRFLTQPLDVLKIRFQLQVEPIKQTSAISKYRAVLQATKTILNEEGIKGLWRGHNSGQLLSLTYGLVQFSTFEMTTKYSDQLFSSQRSLNSHFICGMISGTLATIVSFPFDVTRTRFIAQGNHKAYTMMIQGLHTMIQKEGPTAMFKGLSPTLIQVAPQSGVIFLTHNIITRIIKDVSWLCHTSPDGVVDLKLSGNLVAGSIAGLLGKTTVYPLDLARKRLQLQGFQDSRRGFGKNFKCAGLVSCLTETVKNEGFTGMFKGLTPSIVKAAITTAMHFTVYDAVCKFIASFKQNV